jgi:hypothetical protein
MAISLTKINRYIYQIFLSKFNLLIFNLKFIAFFKWSKLIFKTLNIIKNGIVVFIIESSLFKSFSVAGD